MKKNNFLKTNLTAIKYFKNNCIVKYKIMKNKKLNGQKVSLIDFFIEIGILKENKTKDNKKSMPNKKNNTPSKVNTKEERIVKNKVQNKKIISNLISVLSFIIVSCLISCVFFEESDTVNYLKLTAENETKILNILKSPKTTISVRNTYNNKTDSVDYFFLVVDNLDSYSYKIKLNDATTDLKKELFQNNLKNTTNINTLQNINVNTVVPFENTYLINNKYNINKSLVDKNTLNKIENNIKIDSITNYNNLKYLTISIMTIIISLLLNIIYFNIKKVISKK